MLLLSRHLRHQPTDEPVKLKCCPYLVSYSFSFYFVNECKRVTIEEQSNVSILSLKIQYDVTTGGLPFKEKIYVMFWPIEFSTNT